MTCPTCGEAGNLRHGPNCRRCGSPLAPEGRGDDADSRASDSRASDSRGSDYRSRHVGSGERARTLRGGSSGRGEWADDADGASDRERSEWAASDGDRRRRSRGGEDDPPRHTPRFDDASGARRAAHGDDAGNHGGSWQTDRYGIGRFGRRGDDHGDRGSSRSEDGYGDRRSKRAEEDGRRGAHAHDDVALPRSRRGGSRGERGRSARRDDSGEWDGASRGDDDGDRRSARGADGDRRSSRPDGDDEHDVGGYEGGGYGDRGRAARAGGYGGAAWSRRHDDDARYAERERRRGREYDAPGYTVGGFDGRGSAGWDDQGGYEAPGRADYGPAAYGPAEYGHAGYGFVDPEAAMGMPAGYGPEYGPGYGPGYGPMGAGGYPPAMMTAAGREKRTTRLVGMGVALGGVVLALGFLAVRFGLRAGLGALVAGTGLVPAATPTANAGPTPAVLQTYVSSLTTLGAANWANDGHCAPKTDGYHIVGNFVCSAPFGTSTNLDISVRVKQTSGTVLAPYGVVWRATQSGTSVGTAYEFAVDGNGKWVFMKSTGGSSKQVVPYTANAAIKRGLGAINTLEVRAQGPTFTFLVNGKQVGKVTDSTIAAGGRCGLAGFTGIEVVFSNFSLKLLG